MKKWHFTQAQLLQAAKLTDADVTRVKNCRGMQNKLGFAYQLCFVKLFNRLPLQNTVNDIEELAAFVAVQLDVPREDFSISRAQKSTFFRQQEEIRAYLRFEKFTKRAEGLLKTYLYEQALQIQPTESLFLKATEFLKAEKILNPADSTIDRLIRGQREKARNYIYERINKELSPELKAKLDTLLIVEEDTYSKLYEIKETPKNASVSGINQIAEKLQMIAETEVIDINLDWLNNNYKRYFSRYITRCDSKRLRELTPMHRYAALVCYLNEAKIHTKDHLFDMFCKAINTVISQADATVDAYTKSKRIITRSLLTNHKKLCLELLSIKDEADFARVIAKFPHAKLLDQVEIVEALLSNKHSTNLDVVASRVRHLRKLAKPILANLTFEIATPTGKATILPAIQIVRELIQGNRRTVPANISLEFLPKAVRQAIRENGKLNPQRFLAAVIPEIRDDTKDGIIAITGSKRFGNLDGFFADPAIWETMRDGFYLRNRMPKDPRDVPAYLTQRLERAYDFFLQGEKQNTFAKVVKGAWDVSVDPAVDMSFEKQEKLERLKSWLARNMRTIKLPDLLIEVDNDLHFTDPYLPATRKGIRHPDDVCLVLATLMCYGLNIGPSTMPQIVPGVSYHQLKRMFDWQMTDEANNLALAQIVNGIGGIEVTKLWGEGKTAAGDAQRFGYRRKTIHRTFSHKFNDFAIEFYTFVADNFAPFYNLAKEATQKDTPYVLDGHFYNVSDLDPEEWHFDTGALHEINFAAFALLGKTFNPRLKNIKTLWLYKIREEFNYGSLKTFVKGARHTAKMPEIVDQWNRMGWFYCSMEVGHAPASTALKRLFGFTEKNHFYKANVELGRIFKTEHILNWMGDPARRQRSRQGTLKVEQVHALTRDLTFGNRGRFKGKSFEEITSSGNCTMLIVAAIIYWQAKEISRVIKDHDPEADGVDIMLLKHVSPIEWSNVILYGEYKLNRALVR